MSRKLNVGCGTFPFPFAQDVKPSPQAIPLPDDVYEPGWINIDKHVVEGVQERIDVFRFPWVRSSNGSPFNDDTFDLVWASHIIEHIPHQVHPARGLPPAMFAEYAELCEDFDGFFVFFKEIYRIAKHDAKVYLRFPWGVNYPALCDPTHTRPIVLGTFGYLSAEQDGSAPFDYNIGVDFQLDAGYYTRLTQQYSEEQNFLNSAGMERLMRNIYGVIDEIQVVLRVVKE